MYQAYYNLTGKPFRLSPDPAFFFPSRGHKRALAYLRYGLNQDEGFVVITGAPGTGKTTLAKILLQEMDSSVVVAHLTTTQLEADDMLRMVAASFGLRYEGLDKAGLLKSLEHFLLARSRERKRALLVIDEAQNLPSRSLEELRMLSNLQVGDKALLQIFLLGQEQFRNMLDNPMLEQLRQRVIANYHLTPLAADECQRYVESRLHHVGWNNDPHFAEVAHELIHQHTDGIPRRINMLCDRILLFGCMEETHEITGEVVNLVKKEMEEEISGKAPSTSGADFTGPDEPDAVAEANHPVYMAQKPAASESQRKPEALNRNQAPDSSAPKIPDKEPEQKPQITPQEPRESVSLKVAQSLEQVPFEDDAFSGEFEELDIDYAMFEDKKLEVQSEDTPPVNKSKVPTPVQEKKVTPPKKDKTKTAAGTFTELEEKLSKKDQPAPTKKPAAPEAPSATNGGKQVMGNTVQKTKPETVKSEAGESGKVSEISERDLFRVIPGGKSAGKIPGLDEGSDKAGIAASAKPEPSSSDVRLRRILRLVLAFHRSPSRFPGLDTPAQPLPEGITELLELAISDDQVLNQVSPAAVMGISPVMLRAAVRFFVRRAMFMPEGDHYRTLGLHQGASLAQIEKHYDLLMRLLRQDKQRGSADLVERVGQAYEALSRGESTPSASDKKLSLDTKPVFEDAAPVETSVAKEDSGLLIDFDIVEKQPPKPAISTFVAKPNERFNPQAGGKVSRKTMRYASQLAVLGFGALVIILGLYIVQLEPGNTPVQTTAAITDPNATISPRENQDALQERQRGLLFNDGSADAGSSNMADLTAAINAEAEQIKTMQPSTATASEQAEMEEPPAIAAEEAAEPESSNYQSPLVASLDFDPEAKSSAQSQKAIESTGVASTAASLPAETEIAAVQTEASPTQDAIASNTSSSQPANRFQGRDIEISETPAQNQESFSSIASRTQASKVAKAAVPVASVAGVAASAVPTESAAAERVEVAEAVPPVPTAQPQSNVKISDAELLNLVGNFLSYYEAGNLDQIMTLFAGDARTNNRTNAQGIRADYAELFKSTTARKMNFNALNWSIENDYARGTGDYRSQINPMGTQNSQTFSGNVTLQVQKDTAGLKITRFYFSNQTVSTGPRMQEGAAPPSAPVIPAVAAAAASTTPSQASAPTAATTAEITPGDLQNLVSDFARNYANGEIDALMALFASNAKTNDQTNSAGIRKDYVDLFQSTATRQMTISNMKWTINNQQASGQGPFEVKVQPKGNSKTTTVKGTLKITVVKNGGSSQITEMLHNLQ